MKSIIITLTAVLFGIVLNSCNRPSEPELNNPYDEKSDAFIETPVLQTLEVTDINAPEARSGGVFTETYGYPVTQKGVCWSQQENPTTEDECTNEGEGKEDFTSQLYGLELNRLYYVRAYARNQAGTVYGDEQSFHTDVELNLNIEGKGTIEQKIVNGKTISRYPFGSVVELTANPETGWEFNEWKGDLKSSDNPEQIIMDDQKTVTAVFEKRDYLFYDDFIDNSNDWGLYEFENGFIRLENGYLIMNYSQDGYYIRTSQTVNDFVFTNNFSTELAVLIDEKLGTGGEYFGIEWNLLYEESGSTHRQLHLTDEGYLYLNDRIEGNWQNGRYYQKVYSGYSVGERVLLKIQKEGDQYKIFINDSLADNFSYRTEPASTNRFALVVSHLSLRIDYVLILDKSSSKNKVIYPKQMDQNGLNGIEAVSPPLIE